MMLLFDEQKKSQHKHRKVQIEIKNTVSQR